MEPTKLNPTKSVGSAGDLTQTKSLTPTASTANKHPIPTWYMPPVKEKRLSELGGPYSADVSWRVVFLQQSGAPTFERTLLSYDMTQRVLRYRRGATGTFQTQLEAAQLAESAICRYCRAEGGLRVYKSDVHEWCTEPRRGFKMDTSIVAVVWPGPAFGSVVRYTSGGNVHYEAVVGRALGFPNHMYTQYPTISLKFTDVHGKHHRKDRVLPFDPNPLASELQRYRPKWEM